MRFRRHSPTGWCGLRHDLVALLVVMPAMNLIKTETTLSIEFFTPLCRIMFQSSSVGLLVRTPYASSIFVARSCRRHFVMSTGSYRKAFGNTR
jgi:hypothetical protein